MTLIYDRKLKETYTEAEVGGRVVTFLYETALGRFLLKPLLNPAFSNFKAARNNTKRSVRKIKPFVEKYHINLDEAEQTTFQSFNDFFTRRLRPDARPISEAKTTVIAVADSKLMTYSISESGVFQIKNRSYTLNELIRDTRVAEQFIGGTCLVFRLAIDDYHRYCYPDAGKKLAARMIPGMLHSVRPLAHAHARVFSENTRHWQLFETENFGRVLFMEVGALLVGRIHDHGATVFTKGQEKGYFSYGGSSIVVCYQKNQVKIAEDIAAANREGLEVRVSYGEKVGSHA